jgi:hypothetical protein
MPLTVAVTAVALAVAIAGCCTSRVLRQTGTTAAAGGGCARPYSAASPWNTPIPDRAAVQPGSAGRIAGLGPRLTSDPTQYTYPYYAVGRRTPRQSLRVDGVWSDVGGGGARLERRGGVTVPVPIPAHARPAAGTDGQVIIVDRRTGDEWGAWQLARAGGGWRAENAYHYNVRWNGVPPRAGDGTPFGSRGAGVPYLAGLVRPCEIARGRIDHALALAAPNVAPDHVAPATKSDGFLTGPRSLPEGSRLQLDPSLSAAHLRRWGCSGPCLTIARALQRYGMYVIDGSGRAKVLLEYEGTARWRGRLDQHTVSPLRLSAFRVLEPPHVR